MAAWENEGFSLFIFQIDQLLQPQFGTQIMYFRLNGVVIMTARCQQARSSWYDTCSKCFIAPNNLVLLKHNSCLVISEIVCVCQIDSFKNGKLEAFLVDRFFWKTEAIRNEICLSKGEAGKRRGRNRHETGQKHQISKCDGIWIFVFSLINSK